MNENTNTNMRQTRQFRPDLCFYRASARGTGSAVKMNLHPAHDDVGGCIMMTVANQLTVGNRQGPNPTFSTFDWTNAICVKLDFNDLTQILQVLRGECESINEGKGLYHRSVKGSTCIRVSHLLEPLGYSLDVIRRGANPGDPETRGHFLFSPAEALGICEAIAGAMYLVSFGIPMVIPHDTSAYRADARRMGAVSAA